MRVGSFNIPAEVVRNNSKMCARAMIGMCVVRCEFIYSTDRFHYEAISATRVRRSFMGDDHGA